jgi:hypothetical protein
MRRSCCLVLLLGAACTARPASEFVATTPAQPALTFAAVPPPPALPAEPPGCPRLEVFRDAEDLCKRGIMPMHPYGRCEPLPRTRDEGDPEVSADVTRISAMGGSAELFVKHYIGSGGSSNETVYLAWRGASGYLLLTTVADYSSQGNDVPELERFVGDGVSVEVQTRQEWFEPEFEERRETVRCTLTVDGIRCNDECPDLALARPLPALDCAALVDFDWSELPRGKNAIDDWSGGRFDGDQLDIAMSWLGMGDEEGGHEPHGAWMVDVGRARLTILEPLRGRFALLHDQVPLVASTSEIRVGRAPGGLFVSSWSGGERRIQRLNMATHELENVLPGACG